jgi:hypothetical protein
MARLSMADRLKQSGSATVARLDDARAKLKRQSDPPPTKEHSKEQSIEHTEGHSIEHSNGHSNGRTDTLTDSLADSRAHTLADSRVDTLDIIPKSTSKDTHKHTLKSIPTVSQKSSLSDTLKDTHNLGPAVTEFFWMTPGQGKILYYISKAPAGKTQLRDICNGTGVPYGTVRKALVALQKYNCITKPKKIRIGQWQGLHIELLESGRRWLSLREAKAGTLKDSHKDTLYNTLSNIPNNSLNNTLESTLRSTLDNGHTGGHSEDQSLISSSSLLKETTTNTAFTIIENHPELGYWRQKGLKQRQIQNWMQEFDMSENDIIDFLCYCRFDMVDNDREEKDRIKDVFAWFYKIVQKTGAYPKPNNYMSYQERQIEREKARLDELKRQAEELRKIRHEATKAEFGLQFEQMLQNPEDPIYQECYEKLPPVMKKRGKKGSIVFEKAMKAEFCRLNDIEDC